MEGISASMRKGLKELYWKRRGYQILSGSGQRRRDTVELGTTRTRRRWRIKLAPKIKIPRIPSPKKLLLWLRDAYVGMMLGLANTRMMNMGASASGDATSIAMNEFGRAPPPKEYDEKMIIQIYKSLMMTQGQLVSHGAALKMASEITYRQ